MDGCEEQIARACFSIDHELAQFWRRLMALSGTV
jgi:hypothetical protein